MPELAHAGLEYSTPELRVILLPATPESGMSDTRVYKMSASRAQTRASHKRARGKAPSSTPMRLRRLQAQHMHNNAPVVWKPPDAMAQKQHGHSKAGWTVALLARAGEHEGLSGILGGWKGVAQGNAGTRDTCLEAMEARRPLTSLGRPSATFPQKRLSRKNWSRIQSRTLY